MSAGDRWALIYVDQLLEPTYTFVRDQAEALQRYRACYVGSRRVAGLELPRDRTLTLNQGGGAGWSREILHKLGYASPGLEAGARRLEPALCHAHFGPDACVALP